MKQHQLVVLITVTLITGLTACGRESASTAKTPAAAPAAEPKAPLYTVVDGNLVDPKTLEGWHTWRAMDCERCHGAQQQGLVGPSLIEGLKKLTKEQFETTVLNGRPGTIMPSFKASKTVTTNIDNLYAYLKGRSDGAIKPGDLHPIKK
ncbi:MAG TPA: c-type cytochrome [Burkholderiales bacterium]|nr:c-type cytochrome [Burkholderiales bacterium]